jgi:hypothetical protein
MRLRGLSNQLFKTGEVVQPGPGRLDACAAGPETGQAALPLRDDAAGDCRGYGTHGLPVSVPRGGPVSRTAIVAAAAACTLITLALPTGASASQLIDRNASSVQIAVNAKGEALLTYHAAGVLKHILVWGAINALPPSRGARQVRFQIDYAGGWGKYRTVYWKTFPGACRPYTGPPLPYFVTGCTAPDGSYWAVQNFRQPLPDLGYTPWTQAQTAVWLELSHWSGALPKLEIWQDWVYGNRWNDLFGRFTYNGQPVYGFGTTNYGAPTDGYGRLVYLDTFNAPAYGPGWRRENSFVSHNPTGVFCYGFYPFDPTKGGYQFPAGQTSTRGPGTGARYRITAEGPGVTPDVSWEADAFTRFTAGNGTDKALQAQMTALLRSFGDKLCMLGHN